MNQEQLLQQNQTQQEIAQPIKPKISRSQSWLIVLIVVLLLATIGIFVSLTFKNSGKEATISPSFLSKQPKVSVVPVTPTPFYFKELTIPYLREKKYESKLGGMEEVFAGSNYTAYLTSYTSDRLKINGLLTKPTGEMPDGGWPGIVFIHGYIPPTLYETKGQAYSAYVDYLARNGFVVFKIDLRGHADSEGEPGGAYYSSDYVIDALNARASLQSSDFVNPKKIGLWGHSMSGNIGMRTLAVKPDIPAVVIWSGAGYTYEDLIKYRINDASYQTPAQNVQRQRRRQEIYEKYGSPSAKVVFWQQVSPVTYLKDIKGAIQIHHAVDDEVVNIGYSRDLHALLDKATVRNELFEYPSGGHNISDNNFTIAMERTVEFFKKYLEKN